MDPFRFQNGLELTENDIAQNLWVAPERPTMEFKISLLPATFRVLVFALAFWCHVIFGTR
jgi:hypothetical protein